MDDFYVERMFNAHRTENSLTIEQSVNTLVFFVEESDEECQIELEKSEVVALIAHLQAWLEEQA